MKIYIVYCLMDYEVTQALALQKKKKKKMMTIYQKHDPNSKHIYWIEEKILGNKAIEI